MALNLRKQDNPKKKDQSETQTARRVMYGLNAVIAIAAAIAVVAGVNWLTATQLERLPHGVLRLVRFDLTRTRQYSLSEQTQNTLAELPDGFRVVTLLPENDTDRRQALEDLLDEYKRYAPQLQIQHLQQGVDIPQEDALYADIRDRFQHELGPIQQVVDDGLGVLEQTIQTLQEIVQAAEDAEKQVTSNSANDRIKADLAMIRVELTKLVDQLLRLDRAFEEVLAQPMPRYAELISGDGGLEDLIKQVRATLNGSMNLIQRVKPRLRADGIYKAERLTKGLQKTLDQTVGKLRLSKATRGYDEAANTLGRGPSAVIIGPNQGDARVLPADRLFITNQGAADNRFLGEELITGSLLSLQLAPPPMAVYVISGKTGAFSPKGVFQTVSQRLQTLRFDLREWRIQNRMADEPGNPYAPDPGIERLPGQQVVYIFMPYESVFTGNQPGMAEEQAIDRYLTVLEEKLTDDDGVLVMARPEAKPVTGESKIAPLLRPYRIAPLTYKPVIEERVVGQLREPSWEITFTDWPDEHVITRSLQGQPGVIFAGTAVTILNPSESTKEVQSFPLLEITGERVWALADFTDIQNPEKLKFDPDRWQQSFTPVVASEHGDRRIVFACADAWADDRIVTFGRDGNRNTAAYTGQLFPGNTELFINSTLWLAQLDRLIAKSPRLQDIRRVEPLSQTENTVIRAGLLGGVPFLIGLAGVIVWSIRRRG